MTGNIGDLIRQLIEQQQGLFGGQTPNITGPAPQQPPSFGGGFMGPMAYQAYGMAGYPAIRNAGLQPQYPGASPVPGGPSGPPMRIPRNPRDMVGIFGGYAK